MEPARNTRRSSLQLQPRRGNRSSIAYFQLGYFAQKGQTFPAKRNFPRFRVCRAVGRDANGFSDPARIRVLQIDTRGHAIALKGYLNSRRITAALRILLTQPLRSLRAQHSPTPPSGPPCLIKDRHARVLPRSRPRSFSARVRSRNPSSFHAWFSHHDLRNVQHPFASRLQEVGL